MSVPHLEVQIHTWTALVKCNFNIIHILALLYYFVTYGLWLFKFHQCNKSYDKSCVNNVSFFIAVFLELVLFDMLISYAHTHIKTSVFCLQY